MTVKFTNNVRTKVAVAVTPDSDIIIVDDVSRFPMLGDGEYTYCTLTDLANPEVNEICEVVSINTANKFLSVVRAREGTQRRSWRVNSNCELRLTAELLTRAIADGKQDWSDIPGKPDEFPPSEHTHTFDSITDKPIAYPPLEHEHPELDDRIDALEDALVGGGMFVDAPDDGKLYGRQSEDWSEIVSADGNPVVIADTAPTDASEGDLWFCSLVGSEGLFCFSYDPNGGEGYWFEVSPPSKGGTGTSSVTTDQVATNPDVLFRDSKGRFKSTDNVPELKNQLEVNRWFLEQIEGIEAGEGAPGISESLWTSEVNEEGKTVVTLSDIDNSTNFNNFDIEYDKDDPRCSLKVNNIEFNRIYGGDIDLREALHGTGTLNADRVKSSTVEGDQVYAKAGVALEQVTIGGILVSENSPGGPPSVFTDEEIAEARKTQLALQVVNPNNLETSVEIDKDGTIRAKAFTDLEGNGIVSGKDGVDGKDGVNGKDGADGKDGDPGTDGDSFFQDIGNNTVEYFGDQLWVTSLKDPFFIGAKIGSDASFTGTVQATDFLDANGNSIVGVGGAADMSNCLLKNSSNDVTTGFRIKGDSGTYVSTSGNELALYHLKEPADTHHAATKGYVDAQTAALESSAIKLDLWTYSAGEASALTDGQFTVREEANGIFKVYMAQKNAQGSYYHPALSSTDQYYHEFVSGDQKGPPMSITSKTSKCTHFAMPTKAYFNNGTSKYTRLECKYHRTNYSLTAGDKYMLNIPGLMNPVWGW